MGQDFLDIQYPYKIKKNLINTPVDICHYIIALRLNPRKKGEEMDKRTETFHVTYFLYKKYFRTLGRANHSDFI